MRYYFLKNYIYRFFTPLYKISFLLPIIRILHRIIFALSNLLKTILDIADEEKTVCRLAHRISPDNLVIQGRFAGQKYSNSASVGSSFLPKILGTYEIELEPAWELISDIDFDVVIDVGCAEGFYACGLANMYPLADVYAFDTDMRARQYCEENAKINDLNNVKIHMHVIESWKLYHPNAKFVFVSSIWAYPIGKKILNEQDYWKGMILNKTRHYGYSKKIATILIETAKKDFNLNGTTLVLGTVFGPGDNSDHFIPTIIRKMIKEKINLDFSVYKQ